MQDREISREEAIKRLEEGAPFSEIYEPLWEDALALAIKALKDEPVVRCKNCKKWETINCPFARDFVKWDGFKYCAWGERKEDGQRDVD